MNQNILIAIFTLTLISTTGCTLVVGGKSTPAATEANATTHNEVAHLPALPPLQPTPIRPTATVGTEESLVEEIITPTAHAATLTPSATSSPSATPVVIETLKAEEAGYGLPSGYGKISPTPGISPTQVTPTPSPTPTTPTPLPTSTSVPPTASPTLPPPTATMLPTATPTLTVPTPPPPAAQPAAVTEPPVSTCAAPTARETTLAINTFDYQSALVPTAPGDPVYPYPRLQPDKVGPPTAKDYRAIILENCYLQLTILPDLGGRIYRWIDKSSGQNLFYQNPVIKPTSWGNRGWWLATGGMEWALPLDEHGLSEASPWNYTIHQSNNLAGLTLNDTEEHSGLVSEMTISLDGDHAYFTLTPRIVNPTNAPISYKFWLNGMFSLGSPQPRSGTEFILPGNQVIIHSTADRTLPGANQIISWPAYNGRNLNDYGTWTDYLGVFAAPAAPADFMGAYNHNTKLGVARVFPHLVTRGAKIFAPANLDPNLWTVDGSGYFELWGGLAPTFADTVNLNPGEWITWQEQWYAVNNIPGFNFANAEAALQLKPSSTTIQVAAASTYPIEGQLVLWRDGGEVTRWLVSLAPGRSFQDNFIPPTPLNGGAWGLTLVDKSGRVVAATEQTLAAASAPAASGAQPAAVIPPTATFTPVPTQPIPPTPVIFTPTPWPTNTPIPTALPIAPTATSTSTTRMNGQAVWDTRLDLLSVTMTLAQTQPGQLVYRLVAARYQDETEANGLHHVFVEVLDENGQRITGQPVALSWKDGKATMITENKPAPEYAANSPLYGAMTDGTYEVYVEGAPSDKISGIGLPAKHHVSYLLTFQRKNQ